MVVVIMSVYKNDSLLGLKASIESLYNQTYKKFDIYIQCDGCLPKEHLKYLDNEYGNNRIKLLKKRNVNKGLAFSLNELIKLGFKNGYKYFIRMDADDIADRERVEKQYAFMEKNQDIDVCGSDIIEFYNDGNENYIKYPKEHCKIQNGFSKRTAIPHVTAFFRKTFFEKAGLYNNKSNRNEDQWLWLNGFLNNCKFASIDKPLVKVRLSLALLARRKDFKHLFDTFRLRNKIVRDLKFPKKLLLYNILMLLVKMLPPPILKYIYQNR
jgi:glycosyltransferase involved in cell wall biosynthesis